MSNINPASGKPMSVLGSQLSYLRGLFATAKAEGKDEVFVAYDSYHPCVIMKLEDEDGVVAGIQHRQGEKHRMPGGGQAMQTWKEWHIHWPKEPKKVCHSCHADLRKIRVDNPMLDAL